MTKTTMMQLSNISIRQATRIVAYASLLKAILPIAFFLMYGWFDEWLLIDMLPWIVISFFFFSLYKNIQ